MVRTKTRLSCQQQLDRLCAQLDAQPATLPTDAAGGHWVARAVPRKAKAPATDGRGPAAAG